MRNYLSPLAEPRRIEQKGFGSFALVPIPRGTIIATFGGTILPRSLFNNYPDEQRCRSMQIDTNHFVLGPESREPGDSINHSCSPNCGLRNATQVITLREVATGEELTFDYAMSDTSDYDEFDCACGSPDCRIRVTGNDWKKPELQAKYRGYFSPYVQRKIDSFSRACKLTKHDAEVLMNNFDRNPQLALTQALRTATGMHNASWRSLVEVASPDSEANQQLLSLDLLALDQLAKRLNESRTL